MRTMSISKHTLNMAKKPAPKSDWHPEDIKAAIRKKGTSLQAMSLDLGYSRSTLRNALNIPAPKYERIIAEFLGTTPQKIWPSRYHADGSPKSGRGERGIGRYKAKFNASSGIGNVNLTGAC
jgi:Ner family transcriptional regulator